MEMEFLEVEELYERMISNDGCAKGESDIMMVCTDWYPTLSAANALAPLNDFIDQNPPPDWPDGWTDSMLQLQTSGGRILGLPYHDGPEMFIYRRDLFENEIEKNSFIERFGRALEPPKNWTEFLEVSQYFTRPEDGLHGTLLATFPDAHNIIYDFFIQLWTRGGEVLDADGKVVFNSDVEFNVIGNMKPSGICGTGLIDVTAAMLRAGVLDSTGRILGQEEIPPEVPERIRNRIIADNGQFNFVLADGEASATGDRLSLYQKDIRELQLANGAIRAGISILLNRAGLSADDLGSVLLAGAFGNFIRRSNARRIGMLPQISRSKIRFVGNTASFGAKMVLLSKEESSYAARIVEKTEHLDLSTSPEFQMEFGAAMLFPEDDV